jgi:hypothetical protein
MCLSLLFKRKDLLTNNPCHAHPQENPAMDVGLADLHLELAGISGDGV